MKKLLIVVFLSCVAFIGTRVLADDRVPLLRYVPSKAAAALVAEDGSFDQVQEFLNATPEMRKDLSTFLTQKLGADLTQVDGFAAWATKLGSKQLSAAFLRIHGGTSSIKGKALGAVNGVKLFDLGSVIAASVPGGVILGNEAGVRLAASLSGKKVSKESLASKGALGGLLKIQQRGDLVAALATDMVDDKEFKDSMKEYGVANVVLTVNKKLLRLEAIGDAQRLEQARSMLEGLVAVGLQKLTSERDKALNKKSVTELAPGFGVIVAYHQAKKLWAEVRPQLKADRLVSEYQIPDVTKLWTAWASWGGLISVFALPDLFKEGLAHRAQVATEPAR